MSPNDELCLELDAILSRAGGLKELARNEALKERIAAAYIVAGSDWIEIKDVFRKNKLVRDGVAIVLAKSRELQHVRSIGGAPREPGLAIHDVWTDAPVAEDAVVPDGYGLDGERAAVYRKEKRTVDGATVERQVTVSYDPILITRRMQQKESGQQLLQLQWRYEGKWFSSVFDRDDVFCSRTIVTTAAVGMPVGSDNAFELVQFLRAYETVNRCNIERAYATSSMGWLGDDENPTKHGFMCGSKQIGANGKVFELRTLGAGEGNEAGQIHERGSFDKWFDAARHFDKWPVVKLLTYAMLASVLQPIVDAPNGVIEIAQRRSNSKTYAVMMAQSVWRRASERPRTWDNTLSNFESMAHLYSGIPLILDDTMLVVKQHGSRGEEMLGKAIYKFVSGVGRGRDTKDGGQRSVSKWRTMLISTGENASSDLTHAEGAAARVLTLWSKPTGPTDPEVGALVDDLVHREFAQNYGHVGPRLVKWLHENREEWDLLRAAYDEATLRIRREFPTGAGTRLARIIALLEVTAAAGHAAGCFPWDPSKESIMEDPAIRDVIAEAVRHASQASDHAEQAWIYVMSYAEARPKQWIKWGLEPDSVAQDPDPLPQPPSDHQGPYSSRTTYRRHESREPSSGWLGWRRPGWNGHDWLCWFPAQLRRAFEEGGFNADTILRVWNDQGVLDGPGVKKVKCGGDAGPDAGWRRLYLVRSSGSPFSENPNDSVERRKV